MNVEECYKATVTDTNDPEKRGRIMVTSAELLGDEDAPLPMWVEPTTDWGWFLVPDVGELVEIIINGHGDLDESFAQTSLEALDPRWRGGRKWTSDEAEVPRPVPEDFTATNYGKRRGFATPQGHVLMFDDTEGAEKITFTWKATRAKVDKFSFLSLDEDGSVVISNINGSLIYLNAKDGEVTVIDEHGNLYKSNADGISIIDKFANVISMGDDLVQILAQGSMVVSAKDFTADTGTAAIITGADSFMVRATELLIWLAAHTHPDGMGGTGPSVLPTTGIASTKAKLK